VEKQAASTPGRRHKQQRYVSVGDKNDTFVLVGITGAPENPDSLQIKLLDTGDTVTVTHDQPFRRVDGYTADFRYDPEKRAFRGRRIGDTVSFGGSDYLVADVTQNELILSDVSNEKKTPLPFAP
jgi:hypothetical protein